MPADNQHSRDLYNQSLVWDAHAGFEYDPDNDLRNLFRWHDAGVNFLSVNVGYDVKPWHLTLQAIANYRQFIETHTDRLRLVSSVSAIDQARRDGVLAIAFDIEGMCALNDDLAMVSLYYHLGVRQMLVAYNLNNSAGGGCHDRDVGLTAFGREVVTEMNRVGMLVDCSHTAYRSSMEVMEISEAPVIFSHSNARALKDHERNITDEQIRACGRTGGVVSLTGIGLFLSEGPLSVDSLIDHVCYVSDLIGPEKVGLGLDYAFSDGGLDETAQHHAQFWPAKQYPSGLDIGYLPPESFPEIADGLTNRGFSDEQSLGIWVETSGVWRKPCGAKAPRRTTGRTFHRHSCRREHPSGDSVSRWVANL